LAANVCIIMKEKFLNNEIWVLTFGGGFQRANIYKEKIPTSTRKKFREELRNHIEDLVKNNYSFEISEENHIENIQSIVNFSKEQEFEGFKIPVNFGVAQKLLNLYLKYLWCAGQLKTIPIHFPVDRLIQGLLNDEAKKADIQKRELKAWTQFEDEVEYIKVIRFAEKVMDKNKEFNRMSLAELELSLFNRR